MKAAAAARAQVVRTLVSQLDRLTTAIDEVDRGATALLPRANRFTDAPALVAYVDFYP
jgi:hypothetical protein